MKKITIGISGGIACYKTASLISALKKYDLDIKVIMTENATKFITPLTFETLSKNKVVVNMFEENNDKYVGHIEYGQNTDLLIIVPATANIIGKIANGIADDMLTSTIIASTSKILIIPSMNTHMYENKIVQDNIKKLKDYGYLFIEPTEGMLACGYEGKGKLPDTKTLVDEINKILNFKEA